MQINLVDWLKQMVGNRRSEEVADPSMEVKPTSRALKRALLVALRCVDPDALKRPKMGHVVHMLEAEEFPFRDVRLIRSTPPLNHFSINKMDDTQLNDNITFFNSLSNSPLSWEEENKII